MDNYIVINGKKAELTEEQLRQLGINVNVKKETPFARHSEGLYWYIDATNVVTSQYECNDDFANDFANDVYDNVNHFNNYKFAEQVALHQLLYRKLLKYAYENDAEDCEWDWKNCKRHYYILFDYSESCFTISCTIMLKNQGVVYFSKEEVARQAIEDVIKPFMKKQPKFVW
nr:MAG TPA: hypothetical protein [Caudoviricetes sp.]